MEDDDDEDISYLDVYSTVAAASLHSFLLRSHFSFLFLLLP